MSIKLSKGCPTCGTEGIMIGEDEKTGIPIMECDNGCVDEDE